MISPVAVIVQLYTPLILLVITVFVFIFAGKGAGDAVLRFRPFGHFVEYELPISRPAAMRTLSVLIAAGALGWYLFIDFSSYFPQHLQMEVFYDDNGINESLAQFSSQELANFRIPKNDRVYREEYFDKLDTVVQEILHTPRFFSSSEGSVHSTGETSFIVETTRGWQNYHIVEAHGDLTHVFEAPGHRQKQFLSLFEKLPTRDDYIQPRFYDIFYRHHIIMAPQFKQIVAEDRTSEGVIFKFSFVCITKVTVFPWPRISNSVYLANFESVGLVPIAYAIYR